MRWLYRFEQTKNVQKADAYLDKMKLFINEILFHFPKAGRSAEDIAKNTRKLVYQGFSIIYRLSEDKAELLAIYRENKVSF